MTMKGEEFFELLDEETMDTFKELIHTTRLMKSFLNDQIIADLANLLNPLLRLLNAATTTDLIDVLERAMQEPELDRAVADPPRVGTFGALGSLRDKDVQRGLGIMFALLKALGKAAAELKEINEKEESLKLPQ